MRSFPKIVVSTCGLAIVLIAGASCSSPSAEHVKKIDSPEILELHRAAERGGAPTSYSLGLMYAYGLAVPQDYAEATRWYRRAAEQGHVSAQSSLGYLYYEGRGVPQDYIEAHMWLNLAALHAKGPDRKVHAATRDLVATKMTPEQIAEAQRRAREWKPKSGAGEDTGGKPAK